MTDYVGKGMELAALIGQLEGQRDEARSQAREAVDAERVRIAEAVRGLPQVVWSQPIDDAVHRRQVLAIIEKP